jgi:DNA-binding GntR family transcriptional regulator
MAIEKITNVTLRQKVYDQLRSRILDAELLPGEKISLRGLAEQFGVSLLPVREAVWQLESERVLVVESNKKIRVNHLTRQEFKEVLNLRLLLESEAVDKACQNRPQSAVKKVENILAAMEKHIEVNHKAYIKKNDQFHQTIYSYAGSPLLLELIQRLLARVNPYIYLYAINRQDLSTPSNCHRKMLKGFSEGNSDMAVEALKQDLNHAATYILPRLGEAA